MLAQNNNFLPKNDFFNPQMQMYLQNNPQKQLINYQAPLNPNFLPVQVG
jgi:hypothetical protein